MATEIVTGVYNLGINKTSKVNSIKNNNSIPIIYEYDANENISLLGLL